MFAASVGTATYFLLAYNWADFDVGVLIQGFLFVLGLTTLLMLGITFSAYLLSQIIAGQSRLSVFATFSGLILPFFTLLGSLFFYAVIGDSPGWLFSIAINNFIPISLVLSAAIAYLFAIGAQVACGSKQPNWLFIGLLFCSMAVTSSSTNQFLVDYHGHVAVNDMASNAWFVKVGETISPPVAPPSEPMILDFSTETIFTKDSTITREEIALQTNAFDYARPHSFAQPQDFIFVCEKNDPQCNTVDFPLFIDSNRIDVLRTSRVVFTPCFMPSDGRAAQFCFVFSQAPPYPRPPVDGYLPSGRAFCQTNCR